MKDKFTPTYIPQLSILGHSRNAKYYGISGYDEAEAYLNHPILIKNCNEGFVDAY